MFLTLIGSSMPRLLQINASLNKTSTGRISEQIASLARGFGWDTYMIHGARYVNHSEMQTFQSVTPAGERFHAVKSMLLDAHGLGSSRATRQLIRQIEHIHPDIIHLHNIHGYYLNYKILFEYLQTIDVPIVWTLHDCWPMTGHCAYFDVIECERWKTECYLCPLKNDYPKSLFLTQAKRNYRLKKRLFSSVKDMIIVPVSNWLSTIVKDSFLGCYPCTVINNGVDLQVFAPCESDLRIQFGLEHKMVLLGVASTWDERKGLKDFVTLSSLLCADYQIVLIGVDEVQQRDLPSNIIAICRTESQEELAKYYSLADVFVNPTYSDNFPTTNIESLACGTPVVTYRTGGSPESVTADTGLVVDRGDVNGLISAIEEIRRHGKSHYSEACRHRALQYYNKDDRYADYIKLYDHLLRHRKD